MGRAKVEGLEIRETSIRALFMYQGRQRKETITLNGHSLAPTGPNLKYAKKLVDRVKHEIANGLFDYAKTFPDSRLAQQHATPKESRLFTDVAQRYLATAELAPSTLAPYTRALTNLWGVAFEGKTVQQIRYSAILEIIKTRNWKAKTRNNHMAMLRDVFGFAVKDRLLEANANPMADVTNLDVQVEPPDPFSLAEAEQIITYFCDKYHEMAWNYVEFVFMSGLRTGEAMGLEWNRVDHNKRTVLVNQNFVIDTMKASTKTAKTRVVKLTSRAYAALQRQKRWTYLAHGRIFHDPITLKPWAYEQNFRKAFWTPALKKLGIRYRRPYNMRHTFATVGLMNGVNPAFLSKQLGHALEVFFRVYATWIEGTKDDGEMQLLEAAIYPTSIPTLSNKNSTT